MADEYDMPEPDKAAVYHWVKEYSDIAAGAMQDYPAHTSGKWVADEMQVKVGRQADVELERDGRRNTLHTGQPPIAQPGHQGGGRDAKGDGGRRRAALVDHDRQVGQLRSRHQAGIPRRGSYPVRGHKGGVEQQLVGAAARQFRDREKTLRGLDSLESGQQYLDGWVVQYNLFSDHEGIDDRRPAEMAGVTPPFGEWADIVRNAPALREGRKANLMPSLAEVADRAERQSPRIVPDSTQRRRPKGETDSDDDEEWPRTDSDTVQMARVRRQLKAAIQDIKLPPKRQR